MDADPSEKPALAMRRIVSCDSPLAASIGPEDFVLDASGVDAVFADCAGIILVDGDESRADSLLAAGARRVFLGQAALLDSTVVDRLVARYGGERIGIYAPVRRQAVSWAFETVSNADFKVVSPSFCEPGWEVLKADGTPTGTLAGWWLGALRDQGVRHFLVAVDICDDTDLNICAGMVEDFGECLWLAPLHDPAPPWADWVAFGRCRQLAFPAEMLPIEAQTTPKLAAESS